MIGQRSLCVSLLALACAAAPAAAQEEPRIADLGSCALESGEVIQECRIGYRTAGRLNADRSNAVLFPTWFSGSSASIINLLGPGELVDTTKYYVVAIDAFGNGVSSSPSNSTAQPDSAFPDFSIRDMVRMQHRLATEVLGLDHVRAVMGISMGGMQTFEWITAYPTFMDRAVSIVGSPRLATWDILLWDTLAETLEQCIRLRCENPAGVYRRIMAMANHTPQERSRMTPRDSVDAYLAGFDQPRASFNPYNTLGQLRAMIGHDVSEPFGGSMERARAAVRAELLVLGARQDHVVRPEPANEFARALGARVYESDTDCGHNVFNCETAELGEMINPFLDRPKGP